MKRKNNAKKKDKTRNMFDLDDLEKIKKIDPQNTYLSTDLLLKQCQEALVQVSKIKVPDYSTVENIIFCGMGASIYGALIFQAIEGEKIKYPIQLISDYHLPIYANSKTLIILTSYSGNTEEVLSTAKEAKQKNCKMLILTKGGELANFAKENGVPCYIFNGKLNPAGIPRLGNGYSVIGLLGLLRNSKIIDFNDELILSAIKNINVKKEELKIKAKKDYKKYLNNIPVIFAAEHLSGNAQILRNQFNETSKTFSAFFLVPDLNHHLMEGLQFPKNSNLSFVFLNSTNYSSKIKLRMRLTKEVVIKNNQNVEEFQTSGSNKMEDFLETMIYGAYLTLFLGLEHQQNPATNPWVDYFKDQLKK